MESALSYMIGAYIIFRAAETWAMPDSHFDGVTSKRMMRLLALIVVAIAGLMMYGISQPGETMPHFPG